MVLPAQLVSRVKELQSLLYRRVGTHAQMALNLLFEQGVYVKHVNAMCKLYKRKMLTVTSALSREFGERIQVLGASSGLHVAVVFPEPVFDSKSRAIFLRHEVDVELLSDYATEEQETCDTLILGFGHLSEAAIRDGIRRLKASVDEMLQVQK
jgi:GntR family transcriptional regulator/MocR family aminotransferase